MFKKIWYFAIYKNKKITISILFLLFIVCFGLSYYLGYTLNNFNFDSQLIAISNSLPKECYINTIVQKKDDGYFTYEEAFKISNSFYGKKQFFNVFYKTNRNFNAVFGDDLDINIYFAGVHAYSDGNEMETISLPLFRTNKTNFITFGPKYGAMYPSYIPSALADSLMEYFNFSNYDQLLNYPTVLSVKVDSQILTFSINNIFLNNNTIYWEDNNVFKNNDYYKQMGVWNKDTIFIQASNFFRSCDDLIINGDVYSSYGNFEYFLKTIFETIDGSINVSFNNVGYHDFSIVSISQSSFVINFNFSQCILFFVIVLLLCFVFLILSCLNLNKLFFIVFILFGLFVQALIELLKSAFCDNYQLFLVFNPVGNTIVLICIIICLCFILLCKNKSEKLKNVKINFDKISI